MHSPKRRSGDANFVMAYSDFDASGVRGLQREYLRVDVEANFWIDSSGFRMFEEPLFPVFELAVTLLDWFEAGRRGDFILQSMSYGPDGLITIARSRGQFLLGSVFETDFRCTVSEKRFLIAFEDFLGCLRRDLIAAGLVRALPYLQTTGGAADEIWDRDR